MAVTGITTYQPAAVTTQNKTAGKSALSMDDFFTLLTAQLSNQDMSNPVKDNEFISQMAQFSMVQALADLNDMSSTAYSVSLIGKETTVASLDDAGIMQSHTGIVEGVTLYNGSSEVIVDGVSYPISSVMEVRTPVITIPDASTLLNDLLTPKTTDQDLMNITDIGEDEAGVI